MDYIDIVYGSCNVDRGMSAKLGFSRVLVANEDLKVINVDEKVSGAEGALAIGRDTAKLYAAVRSHAKAVAIIGARIDRKLLEEMSGNGVVLCMPMEQLTTCSGLERTKRIYFMRKLYAAARKRDIHVSFASFARDKLQLCSYMQLIEMAKRIGATEQYARYSLAEINGSLVES